MDNLLEYKKKLGENKTPGQNKELKNETVKIIKFLIAEVNIECRESYNQKHLANQE